MKLAQEAQIVFEKCTQVINTVAQHGQSFDSHAKCVTREFFGVDPGIIQHIGMHYAATKDFQPLVLTPEYVDFRGWLSDLPRFNKRPDVMEVL